MAWKHTPVMTLLSMRHQRVWFNLQQDFNMAMISTKMLCWRYRSETPPPS